MRSAELTRRRRGAVSRFDAGMTLRTPPLRIPHYRRTVSQKYFGASSACPRTTNPITRIAIQIP